MYIRNATQNDIEEITEIYNEIIINSMAIWQESLVTLDNRLNWFNECISQQHPVLVAIDGEQVVGYASFGSWRSGVGYKHTVEHSIHIRHDKRGLAIGSTLMTALIEHAHNIGIHVMVAAVESNNKASIALHFKMGFTESGRFKEVGYKSGQWLDLVFLQKNLVNSNSIQ